MESSPPLPRDFTWWGSFGGGLLHTAQNLVRTSSKFFLLLNLFGLGNFTHSDHTFDCRRARRETSNSSSDTTFV